MENSLMPIEFKNQRILITKQLAEVYQTTEGNVSNNFNNNIEHFEEGKHYFLLQGEELREFKRNSYEIGIAPNVNKLYLWTERGANRHCKILDTDKAWEQFDNLEETYFRVKENKPTCIEDVLIQSLQEMKDMRLQIQETKAEVKQTKEEIQNMRDVYTLNPNSWRSDTTKLINAIAQKLGGFDHIRNVREESYKLLDERAGARLGIRLTNMKKNVLLETGSKAKSDKVSKLDVIAADKKLIEVYCLIVKEMAIKYKAA